MTTENTPIRQQYLKIKKQYPDAIVFFRLGDFYETFDHDAEITARELDIVLTSRNVAKGQRIPMAGIPYHAVENYLSKLIKKGYHVAICEQVGEQPKKGLVPREVIRVVTPGTIYEAELLNGSQNNYLASVIFENDQAGIAFIDITTGEFKVTQISENHGFQNVRNELNRIDAAELLLPEKTHIPDGIRGNTTKLPSWKYDLRNCEEILKKNLRTTTLDGFGMRGKPLCIRAAGSILHYLEETQPAALKMLDSISSYTISDHMVLDAATFRNLEITETLRTNTEKGSLLSIINQTVTPMGNRLIYQWVSQPLLDLAQINQRFDGIEYFIQNGLIRNEARSILKNFADLERLTNRVISGVATPRDIISIRTTLQGLPGFRKVFPTPTPIDEFLAGIHECDAEFRLLENAISDEAPSNLQKIGIIKKGFSSELDTVIDASVHARDWIANLENVERTRTGIKNLKVGYNKVFGYYIEISRSNTGLAPDDYIRKQTLVNAERYITPEMKEYEALVLNAEEQIHEIELRIFKQVCEKLAQSKQILLETARSLAIIDVLASLAEVAVINNYIRPEVTNEKELHIIDARHPVVEHSLSEKRFVPNDIVFEEGECIRIITGPNMSGKSTYLRQVALIALMAQIGCFVPATSARIGIVDRIFTRIGAQDEIHAGQSTFMVEMVETANILNNATGQSLLILDEIGRGTSTYDGVSIAWAVVEFIHNHPQLKSRTLFATHYHELMQLGQILPGVRNYNVAVTESDNNVVFLHKIVPGGSDRSYGIHVGEMAGLPQPVVRRAAEILKNLETTSGKTTKTDSDSSWQLVLFPETNPLIDEISKLDLNTISPIQALNILYDWKERFGQSNHI